MHEINSRLDLNLLRVFLAIWDLRSLTAAGERLGLTQPAISHALRRLREQFDDPLFVRAANRMLPTEIAVQLHKPFEEAFAIINRALQERASFDPLSTTRTFRIAMSDIAEVYALPSLMRVLARAAPRAQLDVVPFSPENLVGAMRSGDVDLAIGYIRNTDQACISLDLFEDRFICLVREGHPIGGQQLTLAQLGSLRFFFAKMSAPIVHQVIEQNLADRGDGPRIAVRGHFTLAPDIVAASDLAAIYPESLARRLHNPADFRQLSLPFDLPAIEVKVHRHSRFANDKGIEWMCETAATALRSEMN